MKKGKPSTSFVLKITMYPSVYYNYAILLSTLGKWDELKELLDRHDRSWNYEIHDL